MADSVRAQQPIVIHPEDTEPLGFIFEDAIPSGVTISSVDEITVDVADELTFGSGSVNASTFNDRPNGKGRTVPIGKAVLAAPSGQVARDEDYLVTVVVTLSSGAKKAGVWPVRCRDE